MKLLIVRDQSKGFLGGVRFELRVKCELDSLELKLVEKYKAKREVLVQKELKLPLTDRSLLFNLTIGSLVNGETFKCADINEILAYEESVREACAAFQRHIRVMATFGGQEVIDFGEINAPPVQAVSFTVGSAAADAVISGQAEVATIVAAAGSVPDEIQGLVRCEKHPGWMGYPGDLCEGCLLEKAPETARGPDALTVRQIADGGQTVLLVIRDDEGDWQFLIDGDFAEQDAMLVSVARMLKLDPTLADLADLPPGSRATRKRAGSGWIRG